MRRVLSFEPGLPTRVLAGHRSPPVTTNAEFFDREGTSLLTVVLAFVLMITDRRAQPPEQWCADAEAAARWVRGLIARTAEMVGRVPSTIRFSYKRVFLRRCAVVARRDRRGLGASAPEFAELGRDHPVIGDRTVEQSHVPGERVHALHGALRDRRVVVGEVAFDHLCDQLRLVRREQLLADRGRASDILLELARRGHCDVRRVVGALAGYRSALYEARLARWRRVELQVMNHAGVRTECVWMNFAPDRLHWARYAGRNFTDRQRIKRKAENWGRRYAALPLAERLAVLGAMMAVGGER